MHINKNLKIQTLRIGAKIKGIKKIGFKINGAPNKIDSFTPKITGMVDERPTAFNCLDLDKNQT